jgi:hypothetical protein
MSRLLDSLVEAISACKPCSDPFSFRALLLKVASIVDTGYMEAVVMRATLLNDKGSKQLQTDAQALLDSFRVLKSSNLPLTAAAVKLLALDLVSRVLQAVAFGVSRVFSSGIETQSVAAADWRRPLIQ